MIFEPLQTRWEGFSLESQHVFHIFACIPEGTKNEAQNLPKWRPKALEKLFREGLKNICFFSLFFEIVLLPIGLQNGAPSRPQNAENKVQKATSSSRPPPDAPRGSFWRGLGGSWDSFWCVFWDTFGKCFSSFPFLTSASFVEVFLLS